MGARDKRGHGRAQAQLQVTHDVTDMLIEELLQSHIVLGVLRTEEFPDLIILYL